MTLTEVLLLIIAIPCAAVTLFALHIGYLVVVNWWVQTPSGRRRADKRHKALMEWATKMEELEKPGAKKPFFMPRRPPGW
jgi:hypothetical protein